MKHFPQVASKRRGKQTVLTLIQNIVTLVAIFSVWLPFQWGVNHLHSITFRPKDIAFLSLHEIKINALKWVIFNESFECQIEKMSKKSDIMPLRPIFNNAQQQFYFCCFLFWCCVFFLTSYWHCRLGNSAK